MKKLGAILLLTTLLITFAYSAENDTIPAQDLQDNIAKGYQCLEDLIEDKDSSLLSFQEAVFSTLALGSQSKLSEKIESEKSTSNCWPKSSCTIKDTAQVLLAYERSGKNTDEIEKWLLSKNASSSDVTWFLQIDISNHVQASCSIEANGNTNSINVQEDMTLSGNPGSCLTIDEDGFWLRVKDSCLQETFEISCDQDFITSTLYKQDNSETIFISPETHSASSSGFTQEKINSLCFKTGSSCDYEGSLWASVALSKTGNDVSPFIPYLLALSQDNEKFLPSAFIYSLIKTDSQYSSLVLAQKQNKYWQATNTPYNKFYDTALALLALQTASSQEAENAKNYLLEIQTSEGCWNNNNIRDTGFILYAGWPKSVSSVGTSTIESCEGAGFFYTSVVDCQVNLQAQTSNNYQCSSFGDHCCLVSPPLLASCSQVGKICSSSEQCSGTISNTIEGSCCLGTCEQIQQASACELNGGRCALSCDETEEQNSDLCSDFSFICCQEKESSSFSLFWILLLLILIVLVVLAIVYRHKLQLLWFKFKNRKSGKTETQRRPPAPPSYPIRQMYSQRPSSFQGKSSQSDRELEDTLKKLKEMSG